MGLFSSIRALFGSSSSSDSSSITDSTIISDISNDSYSDDTSGPFDYGINPSTGLPMISSSIDAGGNMFCAEPRTFDMFDSSSSCSSSFDDDFGSSSSDSGSSAFDSSSSFSDSSSSSSMFDSSSSSSMFDD